MPGRVVEMVAPAAETVYVTSDAGIVSRLHNGSEEWRFGVDGPIRSSVVTPNGNVYVSLGSESALDVVGFDAQGREAVNSDLGEDDLMLATGETGDLYAVSRDGEIYRLSPETGEPLWSVDHDENIVADPVVGKDGTLYVASIEPGTITAYSVDGKLLWSEKTGPVVVSPAIGSVYVATNDGVLWAFDETSGTLRWRRAWEAGRSHRLRLPATAAYTS